MSSLIFVGFEVLTAVVMKRSILWDIMTCCPLEVKRRFGGTSRLYLQGRSSLLAICFMLVSCLSYSSTLKIKMTLK
jgi:hypothetical protein